LQAQHDSADHQYEREGAECPEIGLLLIWVPLRSYDGESNHDAELEGFARSFEDAVGKETYVIKRDLVPSEPKDAKETDVGGES
jgi:hypothetical protein